MAQQKGKTTGKDTKSTGKKGKKKARRKVHAGIAHVLATFNNTVITITDPEGNTLVDYSPGRLGYKGTKQKTVFVATKAAEAAGLIAKEKYGLQEVKVYIKGAGIGRNSAVKGLASAGLRVTMIADVTKTPHNGCRPRRRPRN